MRYFISNIYTTLLLAILIINVVVVVTIAETQY